MTFKTVTETRSPGGLEDPSFPTHTETTIIRVAADGSRSTVLQEVKDSIIDPETQIQSFSSDKTLFDDQGQRIEERTRSSVNPDGSRNTTKDVVHQDGSSVITSETVEPSGKGQLTTTTVDANGVEKTLPTLVQESPGDDGRSEGDGP
ncbi:hypothetical protein, partial [Streptomyces sp. NPDC006309]|uniref:hypothetical protein n=1 Tax=Streptomyces sp. NPDC006309 TaxID=3156749 RepID=UPI0033BCD2D1